jgi:peroxiredoxin (alkyl hydroperoxide reductase subunit C)
MAWLRTIQEKIQYKDMKNMEITFPLIEDIKMDIAQKYGMVQPNVSTTQAVRAVFIIDPKAKVRAIMYYPATTGRNFQEIKRVVVALQTSDAFGVATPADWQVGDDVIVPPPNSCGVIKERAAKPDKDVRCNDWFMCFKKLPKETISQKLLKK